MGIRFGRNLAWAALACAVFLASASLLLADDPPRYSPWSEPVNLGPIVNSGYRDVGPFLSKDGLSLYMTSMRPGGFGGYDIWVAQRATVSAPWGTPVNLGANINAPLYQGNPMLSNDGHRLYFAAMRADALGWMDLYVSRRHNKRDDFGWQPAKHLGAAINTSDVDFGPYLFEDDNTGVITLYFSSNRPGGLGGYDIYASTLQPDETFGPAELVPELSSPRDDFRPALRRDGLEMFVHSDRAGTPGVWYDLWVSTRMSTSQPWSTPVNLGSKINSLVSDVDASLSFDGTELYFASERPGFFGDFDIFVCTRTRLNGHDKDEK